MTASLSDFPEPSAHYPGAGGDKPELFRGGRRITQEEDDEIPHTLVPASGRQLDLRFKTRTLDGLSDKERKQPISTLACLLMQAAGLVVEELNDHQH
ncbi:hypothetical protein [Sinorhizobium meliloti]|uniref:hypothetical protein n=1 Tax=Rhizobium meliloti TaxID=382 RepID=UPI000D1F0BE7|nr:hypothetical protein [Sinorhizobium meliloti]RMI15030.1 hypothetical protein DA102_035675 [Sinorhizobium meliloti]